METMCVDKPNLYARNCPCRDVLDLVSGKWSALVIGALEESPLRFGRLRKAIEGITQKMLTQTLRDLERDGLLRRTVYATTPPQVEYALTQLGRSVADPLRQIREWSVDHMDEIESARGAYDQRRLALVVVESHPAAAPSRQ